MLDIYTYRLISGHGCVLIADIFSGASSSSVFSQKPGFRHAAFKYDTKARTTITQYIITVYVNSSVNLGTVIINHTSVTKCIVRV